MKDRILWVVFALMSFALLYPITHSVYSEWKVYKNGKIVGVTITSLPSEHSVTNVMDFEMNGHNYFKKLNYGSYNTFYVGQKIQLKYLKGYENFFLFPGEYSISRGMAIILTFLLLGCCFLYYGLKKNPTPFRLPFQKKPQY